MRVMHVITGLPSGGAERMLARIAIAAKSGGSDQIVVSMMDDGFFGAPLREAGVRIKCLGLSQGAVSPAALWSLAKLIKTEKPDVLMTWLYHADLAGTFAALIAGFDLRRVVWNVRCSEMDFSRYSWKTRAIARALARLSARPGAVAVNSRAGIAAHQRIGYAPKSWRLLPNGFDLAEWRPDMADRRDVRASLGLADAAIVGICVARLDPQKDHATLLSAFEEAARTHATLRLILVGAGTDSIPLPTGIRSRIIALGERRDVSKLLRGADFAVSSSAYGEGFPNVLGEAMASGLPCIATDVGDAAEIVGETGLIVPARETTSLAAAIRSLAAMDSGERGRLGTAARSRVCEHFSIDRSLASYQELWDELACL